LELADTDGIYPAAKGSGDQTIQCNGPQNLDTKMAFS
jgi:hypothetical protein